MGSFDYRDEIAYGQQVHVIVLEGDLDSYSAPRLREVLDKLIATGSDRIVLDCSALDHIDSSGLGALVSALKQTSDRYGALALAQPNDSVRRVLRVTGLDQLFPIYLEVDEAREACALQPA